MIDFEYLQPCFVHLGMYENAYHKATNGSDVKMANAFESKLLKHNWSSYEEIDWDHLDLEECPM